MSSSLYLKHFSFPTRGKEENYRFGISQTCFDTMYPFFILSRHGLEMIDFEPITIFYGGNGSGKTTALNVIAEKIKAERDALYNRSNFYEDYLRFCDYEMTFEKYENARIITSDDVFDFMLTLRAYNEDVDEPENSLSPERQLELVKFITDCSRVEY